MNKQERIVKAVEIFHELTQDTLPRPGQVMAHLSDERAYEVGDIQGETVKGFYIDEETGNRVEASFPLYEVFNPTVVMELEDLLQSTDAETAKRMYPQLFEARDCV
jgi:hypothetical protein